jgi:hypothetical protein
MIMLGTDPETFAVHPSRKALEERGLQGSEDSALPAFFAMDLTSPDNCRVNLPFGTLTPDGLALEYTVDPTGDPDDMVERMRANIRAIQNIVDKFQAKLSVAPRIYVDPWYIEQLPVSYGKACSLQLLGCDPDRCAYGWELPKKPDPRVHTFRTSGGHIHFGLGKEFVSDQTLVAYFVALCDSTLGAASTILCDSVEALLRKEQYGMPGMFRTDPGRGTLEYRTMPGQMFQTPELTRLVFQTAADIGNWAHDIFVAEGQKACVAQMAERIGGIDTAMTLAGYIRDHDTKGCLAYMQADYMSALLDYDMPKGFEIHGW